MEPVGDTMTRTTETAPNDIIIGVDLAQAKDWTAIVVAEVLTSVTDGPNRYAIRAIRREQPRRYQDTVAMVADALPALREGVHVLQPNQRNYDYVQPSVTVVLDRTGVGRAVGDMFSEARLDCRLELVTITSGHQVNRDDDGGWLVPKKDLTATVAVALQNGWIEWPARHPLDPILRGELKNFRHRYSATGRESSGAGDDWREGNHDDLVLAVALSLWWGERRQAGNMTPEDYEYTAACLRAGGFG